MLKHHRCDVILGEYPSYVLLIIYCTPSALSYFTMSHPLILVNPVLRRLGIHAILVVQVLEKVLARLC